MADYFSNALHGRTAVARSYRYIRLTRRNRQAFLDNLAAAYTHLARQVLLRRDCCGMLKGKKTETLFLDNLAAIYVFIYVCMCAYACLCNVVYAITCV